MRIIFNRQAFGDYGSAAPGQVLDTTDELGAQLVRNGIASLIPAPRVLYETKVVTAGVPRYGETFCKCGLPDTQSPRVSAAGDSVVSGTDVSTQRAVDRSGRRGRPRRNT